MTAIILAAGYGNRMRPLTNSNHKALLQVAGHTILGRIIDSLIANGITDIVIVTGYRADDIISYVSENYDASFFTFIHNERFSTTNNIHSLALAFKHKEIASDVVLIESDLIYDNAVIEKILHSQYENVALVDNFRHGMDGTVVTVSDNVITSVIPPHLQGDRFDFSDKYKTLNIYKFSQLFCNTVFKKLLTFYSKAINDNCYYELILGILIYMQQHTIHAEILSGEKWAEVDDPNDLRIAEYIFDAEKRSDILESTFGGYWSNDLVDFYFIRNMYFPNASIFSEMRSNLVALLHNYGSRQSVLNRKLAYFLLCNADRLQVLNGASQVFPLLKLFFKGKSALIPKPTFGEFYRIFEQPAYYHDAVGYRVDDLTHQLPSADIIVFVNPNNPTGTTIASSAIVNLAVQFPEKFFVVDESFIDFSEQPSIITLLESEPLDNIAVIKSLSKVLGIPGARLGFIYTCNHALHRFVADALPIWNSNSIAEFFLEIILKHRTALAHSFTQTCIDRQQFQQQLSTVRDVEQVFASGANFLLVRMTYGAEYAAGVVKKLLEEHAIYIKNASDKFSDGRAYFRFAVRTPDENRRLIEALNNTAAPI